MRPSRVRMRVVLPAPFGPSRPTAPAATSTVRLSQGGDRAVGLGDVAQPKEHRLPRRCDTGHPKEASLVGGGGLSGDRFFAHRSHMTAARTSDANDGAGFSRHSTPRAFRNVQGLCSGIRCAQGFRDRLFYRAGLAPTLTLIRTDPGPGSGTGRSTSSRGTPGRDTWTARHGRPRPSGHASDTGTSCTSSGTRRRPSSDRNSSRTGLPFLRSTSLNSEPAQPHWPSAAMTGSSPRPFSVSAYSLIGAAVRRRDEFQHPVGDQLPEPHGEDVLRHPERLSGTRRTASCR